jgi:hypothetical protein
LEIRFVLTRDEADHDEFQALQRQLEEYESGKSSETKDESDTEA